MKLFIFLFYFASLSCSRFSHQANKLFFTDGSLGISEYDFFEILRNSKNKKKAHKLKSLVEKKENTNPEESYILPPERPSLVETKNITINVSEEVPVLDLILEIARVTNLNIQVDPSITGGVILNVTNQDVKSVFNRICSLTEIRYKEKGDVIMFERDSPYSESYAVDFLDITRGSNATMQLNTSVISSNGAGSSASVNSSSVDQFWEDLKNNMLTLIDSTEDIYKKRTKIVSKIQKKQDTALLKLNNIAKEESSDQPSESLGAHTLKNQDQNNQDSDDSTNVFMNENSSLQKVQFNKKAGIIIVTATEKSHRKIKQYLEELKKKTMAQVLIELKFVEITLNKEYQAGINLNSLSLGGGYSASSTVANTLLNATAPTVALVGTNVSAVAKFLENFGIVRTLISPRVTALNNQPTLLTMATNKVYFTTKVTMSTPVATSGGATSTVQNVESEAKTIPVGIVLSVMPSINLQNGMITINIKPTISDVEVSGQADPSIQAFNQQTEADVLKSGKSTSGLSTTKNEIPITKIRELDSIIKIANGNTAVIGGYTERRKTITDNGVPFLKSIPLIGNLFSTKIEKDVIVETLIIVRAVILDENDPLSPFDYDIYHTLAEDPRDL